MSNLGHSRRFINPYSRELEPIYQRRPGLSIGGLLLLGGLVGLFVWIWPELQRTVRIHRM